MGNIFSRKLGIKEELVSIDKNLETLENELKKLENMQGQINRFLSIAISLILVGAVIYFKIYIKEFIAIITFGYLLFSVLPSASRKYRIEKNKKQRKNLIDRQKYLISMFKIDEGFMKAKEIISREEDRRLKEAYFAQIQKKKTNNIDKICNIILGDDPTAMYALICHYCGIHNGLLDIMNSDIKSFKCYSCGKENMRIPKNK